MVLRRTHFISTFLGNATRYRPDIVTHCNIENRFRRVCTRILLTKNLHVHRKMRPRDCIGSSAARLRELSNIADVSSVMLSHLNKSDPNFKLLSVVLWTASNILRNVYCLYCILSMCLRAMCLISNK